MFALFAKPAQPVLADEGVETALAFRGGAVVAEFGVGDVALGAAGAVGAVAGVEGAADRTVGGEADLLFAAEEG